MAPDEPSAPRRRRRSALAAPAASPAVLPSSASLSELIEHERSELTQIHAMVKGLNDVLLYADDDDSPMHADVAYVIARLLDESLARLEAVRVRVAQLEKAAADSEAGSDSSPPHQVREPRATYLC